MNRPLGIHRYVTVDPPQAFAEAVQICKHMMKHGWEERTRPPFDIITQARALATATGCSINQTLDSLYSLTRHDF